MRQMSSAASQIPENGPGRRSELYKCPEILRCIPILACWKAEDEQKLEGKGQKAQAGPLVPVQAGQKSAHTHIQFFWHWACAWHAAYLGFALLQEQERSLPPETSPNSSSSKVRKRVSAE